MEEANLNSLLYQMAKKLDRREYWKKLMQPQEIELIRSHLVSEETWSEFLLLGNPYRRNHEAYIKLEEVIAMWVRALLFDQWIPQLFPDSLLFCSTVLNANSTYTEHVIRADEFYDTLEDEMQIYASVKSQIVSVLWM
jgi:hypothetical protein